MRMILAALPLALAVTACQTYPAQPGPYGQDYPYPGRYYPDEAYPPATYPGQQPTYRATGTEPFWELTIGRDMTFVDRGINLVVTEAVAARRNAFAGEIYEGRRLNVNVVHGRCSDGMSGQGYPDQVQVWVDGRSYRGCGGPVAAYPSDGRAPPYPGTTTYMLSQTNWTVVAINGRPTPRNGYYLNFMPDRLSGKFGCNSLGAGYTVSGATLNAGAVLATRMACPDLSFESQGSAVLGQPMAISGSGDRLTLSNRAGSIELLRAR